jgi:hypothetical protein
VTVPPGRHEVRLVCRPRAVTLGLVASAVTLGAVLLALAAGRSRDAARTMPDQGRVNAT